jgi:alpha-N-arabinofuranosidase
MRNTFILLLSVLVFGNAHATSVHKAKIDVDGNQGTISRHLYGHFAEHLGRGIYDGIWFQNEEGEYEIREDVVAALKDIQIPNIRWPGGCFADYYHWQDGVGDKSKRPSVVNNNWGGVTENNSVGTHEFLNFSEYLNTVPIVVGNVGSGTVAEMSSWWEYINHPGESPMANLRRENGREQPWNVKYWGVGNESWGCGGNMKPEHYANLYRQYASFLPSYPDAKAFRIATGPAGNDYNWTEVVMREAGDMIDGLDLHHYTINGSWETKKGEAVNFDRAAWYSLMHRTQEIDTLLDKHSAIMDKYDPEKRVWLIVGEWGTWHEQEEGSTPGFLYQQNTIRDALTASVTLDIFHKYLDRVKMANIAQTVNVLQAMILTQGEQMILTPTYHVFKFHTVHHDARSLPIRYSAGKIRNGKHKVPAISMSASQAENGAVNLTITNVDLDQARHVEVELGDYTIAEVNAEILTAEAMNSHNTFDKPNKVAPKSFSDYEINGSKLLVKMPAKSMGLIRLQLN